jgi:hypothetical protein
MSAKNRQYNRKKFLNKRKTIAELVYWSKIEKPQAFKL